MTAYLRDVIADRAGNVQKNVPVHIYDPGTSTPISDEIQNFDGDVLTQPLATDANGTLEFMLAAPRVVDIVFTIRGADYRVENALVLAPSGGGSGSVTDDQQAALDAANAPDDTNPFATIDDLASPPVPDFTFWSPDAPPRVPGALDEEWWSMPAAAGAPAGWTVYDPGNRLTVSIDDAGLKLEAAPIAALGEDSSYILADTLLLNNHTYDVFAHQPDVPRKLHFLKTADPNSSLASITFTVHGTDANDNALSGSVSLGGSPVAETNVAFKTVSSIVTSGAVGLDGDEHFSVGQGTIAPQLCGIYRDIPAGDGSLTFKMCGGGDLDYPVFTGLAFFEDAADLTKFIYAFGEHWFGDVQTNQYDYWFGPVSVVENDEAASGYMRVRRNADAYTMDFSAQGLSFASTEGFSALSLGIVPQHFGFIIDNPSPVAMAVSIPFLRYVDSDVGLSGRLDGAKVGGFYAP